MGNAKATEVKHRYFGSSRKVELIIIGHSLPVGEAVSSYRITVDLCVYSVDNPLSS